MGKGVVLSQPGQSVCPSQAQIGFMPLANNFQFHPDLGVLERNWVYVCKHDRTSECCSMTSFYQIFNGQSQVIMSGTREFGGNCCGADYSPLIIIDPVTQRAVMEVVVSGQQLLSFGRTVSVSSPPGNPVGGISRGGFLANHFDIQDAKTGRVFVCQEKWRFFSGSSFPIKDAVTGVDVAYIQESSMSMSNKFTMTITDQSITPFQKALFLGLLILEDTIEEEDRRR